MGDVVSIDVARVRAAARTVGASGESLDATVELVAGRGFGWAGDDPARERAIREGYRKLARAIGVWSSATDRTARVLVDTADGYDRQDAATAADVVALGGR